MRVEALQRWHWLVIAVAVGVAIGYAWESTEAELDDPIGRHGEMFNRQQEFEAALVAQSKGLRLFKDVTVHPFDVPGGAAGPRSGHIVAGSYWDGREEFQDGRMVARYEPRCFVAPVPYHALPTAAAPATAAAVRVAMPVSAAQQPRFESVVDYLNQLGQTNEGFTYRTAAWWRPGNAMAVSLGASVLVIGLVWPTVVNLLTFGTLTRPAEAKGMSLWKVRSTTSHRPQPAVPAFAANAGGADSAVEPTMAASPEVPGRSSGPVVPLAGEAVAAANVTAPEDKEFGASPDDFYPTELHGDHRPGR